MQKKGWECEIEEGGFWGSITANAITLGTEQKY
jgi:hypothetical protein